MASCFQSLRGSRRPTWAHDGCGNRNREFCREGRRQAWPGYSGSGCLRKSKAHRFFPVSSSLPHPIRHSSNVELFVNIIKKKYLFTICYKVLQAFKKPYEWAGAVKKPRESAGTQKGKCAHTPRGHEGGCHPISIKNPAPSEPEQADSVEPVIRRNSPHMLPVLLPTMKRG